MSTLKTDTLEKQNTAIENYFVFKSFIKVYANFGVTPTIENSGNVSTLTDNAVANYTMNFANSFVDDGYAVGGFGSNNDDTSNESFVVSQDLGDVYSASALNFTITENTSGNTGRSADPQKCSVVIMRD